MSAADSDSSGGTPPGTPPESPLKDEIFGVNQTPSTPPSLGQRCAREVSFKNGSADASQLVGTPDIELQMDGLRGTDLNPLPPLRIAADKLLEEMPSSPITKRNLDILAFQNDAAFHVTAPLALKPASSAGGSSVAKRKCKHRILKSMCKVCKSFPGQKATVSQPPSPQSSLRKAPTSQAPSSMVSCPFAPPSINIRDLGRRIFHSFTPGIGFSSTIADLLSILQTKYPGPPAGVLQVRTATAEPIKFVKTNLVSKLPPKAVYTYQIPKQKESETVCCVVT